VSGSPAELRIHAIKPRSRANGPGTRFVIWVQGCSLGCPGCFNPDTHAGGGPTTLVDDLVARIENEASEIEGITVSGGEPFEQPQGLLALVEGVRARTALSVVVFSGFSRAEIEARPLGPTILNHLDVLIDGRYVDKLRVARGLKGSRNQSIVTLSSRYSAAQIDATPEAEITIAADGTVTISGVDPLKLPS
jgi:anaerobic ribonucleoside-triphosphate reductase activating protein